MNAIASQITSLTSVYLTVYSRRRWKKTSKLRVTDLCAGNSTITGEFPHKGPVTRKIFPFDDVIMYLAKNTCSTFEELYMMTSSNGNIFRVTGPLCGEFTGPGEFPTQRPVTRSFDDFFDVRLNKRLSKHSSGWWFETLSWSLWRHHNDIQFPLCCVLFLVGYWSGLTISIRVASLTLRK